MSNRPTFQAATAAHRFGLGEARLDGVRGDPQGWLLAQIGPADSALGAGLPSTRQALELVAAEREQRRRARNPPAGTTALGLLSGHYREVTRADSRSRLLTAIGSERPFAERLQLFWCNHFTVSLAKGGTRGLVGAFEREAIRPNIAGSFQDLLFAATSHPAMLRYLDNAQSAGPNSRVVARLAQRAARAESQADEPRPGRITGLNENLAREVLELHTLGAVSGRGANGQASAGVYSQADVSSFAAILTGWRGGSQDAGDARAFDPAWHEPGAKTLLGRRYAEGPDALRAALHDLARHASTARFIAAKLARHFAGDTPAPALAARLAARFIGSDGQLAEVYRELVRSPEAWSPAPAKLKTPEEFVVSSLRLLAAPDRMPARPHLADKSPDNGSDERPNETPEETPEATPEAIAALGQRIHHAPSPAGWSDRADDWLGPDAVWKRIEWASRTAARRGAGIDARDLAAQSLGPLLSTSTRQQIEHAADGPQALALLLMAPEFQRR